jgi:hypothetical protein
MPSSLRSAPAATQRLKELQFRRYERCHATVQAFIHHRRQIARHPQSTEIWRLYDWLLCPLTFWALDYLGISAHVLAHFQQKRDFDADTILLLKLIDPPPSTFAQSQVGEYEKTVTKGLYDHLTKQPEKFRETETLRGQDLGLQTCWNQIKGRFPLAQYRNQGGVVRRSLSRERNFDAYHAFGWYYKRDRFQVLLDALCYRWCLYGFELDRPLLLKVSVNPTPYGTMILVPKHLSLDGPRDLDWQAIGRIHRAHGARRQGAVLSSQRIVREAQRQQAARLTAEAKKLKLRGKARSDFILRGMNLEVRRVSWLKTLLRST